MPLGAGRSSETTPANRVTPIPSIEHTPSGGNTPSWAAPNNDQAIGNNNLLYLADELQALVDEQEEVEYQPGLK